MKIYKYEIKHGFFTPMPKGATPLSVGQQGDSIVCWALVDPDEAAVNGRKLAVYGTGHPVQPEQGRFIGTVQMTGGMAHGLVFHVFDEGETSPSED